MARRLTHCVRSALARAGAGGRGVQCSGGQHADLPQAVVVFGLQPPLGVASPERDQLLEELDGKEQVAQQLAVDRTALRVDGPSEQCEIAVSNEAADTRVVAPVDLARKAPDLEAIAGRDEDVGNL